MRRLPPAVVPRRLVEEPVERVLHLRGLAHLLGDVDFHHDGEDLLGHLAERVLDGGEVLRGLRQRLRVGGGGLRAAACAVSWPLFFSPLPMEKASDGTAARSASDGDHCDCAYR